MRRLLGLDLAITAENRACLTDEAGKVLAERRFRLTRSELDELHLVATLGLGPDDELVVTMEPTANAWVACCLVCPAWRACRATTRWRSSGHGALACAGPPHRTA